MKLWQIALVVLVLVGVSGCAGARPYVHEEDVYTGGALESE